MIKKVETVEDVLAIVDICPHMAKAPLFVNGVSAGVLDKDYTLGVFYDDDKRVVFRAYVVYADRDDITFIMDERYVMFDYCCDWDVNDVIYWHAGCPEKDETESMEWWKL